MMTTVVSHHLLTVAKEDAQFLVDLRPPEAFARKSVMGSINVPFESLLTHKTMLLKQPKILLLAENDTLQLAEEAYLILTALGAEQVLVVPTGFTACKQAKCAITYPPVANVKAMTGWYNTLTPAEKMPTLLGGLLLLLGVFGGKNRGLLFGIGSTMLGFGLRNKIKADKANSLVQWVVALVLRRFA